MSMIAIFSCLVGAVLGTRFRVHVLFPATALGVLLLTVVAGIKGSTITATALSAVIFVGALQLGYIGGLFTRYFLAAARLASHRVLRSKIAQS